MQMYQLHYNSWRWTWWKQQVMQVSNTSVARITQSELHHTATLLFKTKYIYILLHSSTVTQLSHNKLTKFYILLTGHLVMILGKRPTWRTVLFYVFISILYMFHATSCSSSGESIVSIQPLVYVTLCQRPFCVQVRDRFVCRSETCTWNGHWHRVTYTRGCIDTIDSPDDEHEVAQNM